MTIDAAGTVRDLRETFASGRTRRLAWRTGQLRAMHRMLTERHRELEAALAADLGKPAAESWLTEIGFLTAELEHTLKNLEHWLAPRRAEVPMSLQPATGKVVIEPLGVVLVIAPWNYPVQLLLAPMIGALAAGNTVLAKPSELAPASSAVLATMVPQYLDSSAVRIVAGGKEETTEILRQRFDHIFYTGNGTVGKVVMRAAAEHLTPVTLELGGKSPTYVDDQVNLRAVAQRLVWGKFMNAGQTCVAPDYLLASRKTQTRLIPHLRRAITDAFGTDPRNSDSYGRIISERHFDRLTGLLDGQTAAIGGQSDAASRYLAPTVLAEVAEDTAVMKEEIFGPILPLVTVDSPAEAVDFITARDKPLALYLFTDSAETKELFIAQTSAGGMGIGVPTAHLTAPGLPFGGVGQSGIGNYHGRYSIDTFSHHKAVLDKPLRPDTLKAIYPPFTTIKEQLIRRVLMPIRRKPHRD